MGRRINVIVSDEMMGSVQHIADTYGFATAAGALRALAMASLMRMRRTVEADEDAADGIGGEITEMFGTFAACQSPGYGSRTRRKNNKSTR